MSPPIGSILKTFIKNIDKYIFPFEFGPENSALIYDLPETRELNLEALNGQAYGMYFYIF